MLERMQDQTRKCTLRRREQAGETLIEILIAVVIMGLVISAIFATYATAATSSKSQRDLVTADAELRDYAEAAKAAAKTCTTAGQGLTLPPPAAPYTFPVTSAGLVCPSSVTTVQRVDITVTPTGGTPPQKLSIDLRIP
jgi:type II secretory pathway pseudopilin PulG